MKLAVKRVHFLSLQKKNDNAMKSVEIPVIDSLENLQESELRNELMSHGALLDIDCAPWTDAFPYQPRAHARVAASPHHLMVLFSVDEEFVKAEFMNLNDPVSRDSCVEIFIADADNSGYWNFEFNCIGTLLAAHRNERRVNVQRFTPSQASELLIVPSLVREPIAPVGDVRHWELLVGIPFGMLGYDTVPATLRVNLYKCADDSPRRHYLSWSPIGTPAPDFHNRQYFGRLDLARS